MKEKHLRLLPDNGTIEAKPRLITAAEMATIRERAVAKISRVYDEKIGGISRLRFGDTLNVKLDVNIHIDTKFLFGE